MDLTDTSVATDNELKHRRLLVALPEGEYSTLTPSINQIFKAIMRIKSFFEIFMRYKKLR